MSTKAERDAALDLIGNLIEVTRRNWLSGDRADCEAAIKLGVAAEIMAEAFAAADRYSELKERLETILGPGSLGQYFNCKAHPSGGWMLGPTLDRQVADQIRRDLFQDDNDQ